MHCQCNAPEEWRAVVGYEGWYSVSSCGRVRRDMPGRRTTPGRILKPFVTKLGYLRVGLCSGSHASLRLRWVHRLVAEAFVSPRPDGHTVNHIDGVKTNNHPSNLEWLTPGDNSRHAARMGLLVSVFPESARRTGDAHHARMNPERLARGSKSGQARLTEDAVRAILRSPLNQRTLAKQYGVAQSTISWIKRRVTWRHVVID